MQTGITVPSKAHKRPRTRWDKIPELLRDQAIDVLIAVAPENVTYTSGHYEFTLSLIRDRIAATIIPADGEATYLVVDRIEPSARQYSWISDVVSYRETAESPIKVLAGILRDKGCDTGTVAIDEEYLSAGYYQELKRQLPEASLRNGSAILARVRSVKTDEEVAFIETAIKATETAHLKVYQTLKPGDTEAAIARRLEIQNLLEGSDSIHQSFVAAGSHTIEGHHIPDDTPIRPGDVLMTDSGGKFAGYFTDMARAVVVGKPNARQRSMYEKLRDVHFKGVDSLLVGTVAGEAFDHLRTQPEYKDVHFFGHSLGVFPHDAPMVTPYYEDGVQTATNISASWELEPNMVIMVEFALTDWEKSQRYHFENLALVTDKGPRILSDVIDTAEMFVVD